MGNFYSALDTASNFNYFVFGGTQDPLSTTLGSSDPDLFNQVTGGCVEDYGDNGTPQTFTDGDMTGSVCADATTGMETSCAAQNATVLPTYGDQTNGTNDSVDDSTNSVGASSNPTDGSSTGLTAGLSLNSPTLTPPPTPGVNNSCIQNAIAAGAVTAGVDAIGLIPEAGGIARILGHGAGFRGVVGDQVGHRVIDAVGKSGSTAVGLSGILDRTPTGLLSTGLIVVGFVPGLGQASAGLSVGLDIYKTVVAIGKCN